ncbi:hypothetical protein BJY21_003213 [Kineosphaera limosa]|nr:hypothetical protein [Kineosphaera limosa]NYE02029.1 hypothetical protein [Kineosphaera limosa]
MSPSSLIFVAVVAIWAIYLVVHVARRREHLATARTVDRFSSQMRVLQRRAVRLDPPAPSSVRVSSTGRARPRPLIAQASPEQVFLGNSAPGAAPLISTLSHDGSATAPEVPDFFVDEPGRRGRGLRLPARRPGSRPARLVRAAALLLALLSLVVVSVAAGLSALPWWAVAAPVAMLIGVLAWLRAAARALRAQRRRAIAHARRERERAAREARLAAAEARPSAPSMPVAQEFVAAAPIEIGEVAATLEPAAQAPARSTRPDPLEVAALAHSSIDAANQSAAVDPLLADDGWAPTPVPPPTYTLKAKAQRPLPPPMEVPVPIEVDEDDVAWDEARHQPRVVSA